MIRKLLIAFSLTIASLNTYADFSSCKFMFGTDWDYLNTRQQGNVATNVDYVTIWLNDANVNQYWHGTMLSYCKNNNKTPVLYAYIIAKASGLGDGDVGGGLTTKGAEYLKGNFSGEISRRYTEYATKAAQYYGTDKPIIWIMEPDYYQYFSGNQTTKLSYSDAGTYMKQLISIVKGKLPKAQIALDISPWNNDQSSWLKNFDMSQITFMATTGGRTEAGSDRIRNDNNNNVTWAGIYSASGKPIIADDGYGTGGSTTGHDATWDDVNNLKNRISNGVCAITQKSPNDSWGISAIRSSINSVTVKCYGGTPVIYPAEKTAAVKSPINIMSVDNGFRAVLSSDHKFQSYSLVGLDGRIIQNGKLTAGTTDLFFNGSAGGMKFIRFEGANSVATYPVAAVK